MGHNLRVRPLPEFHPTDMVGMGMAENDVGQGFFRNSRFKRLDLFGHLQGQAGIEQNVAGLGDNQMCVADSGCLIDIRADFAHLYRDVDEFGGDAGHTILPAGHPLSSHVTDAVNGRDADLPLEFTGGRQKCGKARKNQDNTDEKMFFAQFFHHVSYSYLIRPLSP